MLPFESHFFNFLLRYLLLFLSCICASARITPCSKLEHWCFTHWHPDRPAQLACLWYARKILFTMLLISVSWIAGAIVQISFIFYLIPSLIARYAPPISFNFFNLIRLGSDKTTIFEQVNLFSWFNVLLSSFSFFYCTRYMYLFFQVPDVFHVFSYLYINVHVFPISQTNESLTAVNQHFMLSFLPVSSFF